MTGGWTGARVARTVAVMIVLGLALMWIYVLFIANPESTSDKLNSDAFSKAAQPVCKSTVETLGRLGVVNKPASSPQERATLVDTADAELQKMVQQLRTLVPPPGDDATAVGKWLDDWDQWLRDRAAWSERLHRGEDAPFLEKQRSTGEPNSKALDDFALINSMPSCATPAGV